MSTLIQLSFQNKKKTTMIRSFTDGKPFALHLMNGEAFALLNFSLLHRHRRGKVMCSWSPKRVRLGWVTTKAGKREQKED